MTEDEKLDYLLIEFQKGKYNTNTFCNQFTDIYDNIEDYDILSEIKKRVFRELSTITARFSADEGDLKLNNVYYSEQQVKSKVEEIIGILNQNDKSS